MVRRVFLVATTRAILGGIATILMPRLANAAVNSSARQLKGTPNGQVLESLDGGDSWRVCADLGSAMEIQRLVQGDGQFFLQVNFQGHPMVLKSPNGHTWYTSEWSPPSVSFRRTFMPIMGG